MVFSPYHESWRNHPGIGGPGGYDNFKFMFPGFGYAVAIFSTYLAAEFMYAKLFPPKHAPHVDADFDGPRYEGAFEPKPPPKDPYAVPH